MRATTWPVSWRGRAAKLPARAPHLRAGSGLPSARHGIKRAVCEGWGEPDALQKQGVTCGLSSSCGVRLGVGHAESESRKQKAESRKQKKAKSRKRKAESEKQKAESRKQKASRKTLHFAVRNFSAPTSTVSMGKKAANTRSKKRSKKQQQSAFFDTDDDSDCALPRSAYELQCREKIASNQGTLDLLGARLDMSEEPRNTDGAPKQPKKRCEPKPLHAHAAVPL